MKPRVVEVGFGLGMLLLAACGKESGTEESASAGAVGGPTQAGVGPDGSGGAVAGAAGAHAGAATGHTGGASGAPFAGAGGTAGAGGSGAGVGAGEPTFTRVWNEVLAHKGCAGVFCHGAGQGGLSMHNQADAYASLVGVAAAGPSCSGSPLLRVQPGAPEGSLMLDKMSKELPSCGEAMPIGGRLEPNCLSDDPSVCTTGLELELVRAWIAAGAMAD